MKGLLRKDLYQILRYGRTMLMVIAVFLVVSLLNEKNMFFLLYPCLLCGMMPVTLLSYDERSGWSRYALTMPCTRGQLVTAKYLIGLLMTLAAGIISMAAITIRSAAQGTAPAFGELLQTAELMLSVGLLAPALTLPWMFRLGVEKGRLAYYGVLVLFFGGAAAVSQNGQVTVKTLSAGTGHLGLVCAAVVFAASCALSVALVRKREE